MKFSRRRISPLVTLVYLHTCIQCPICFFANGFSSPRSFRTKTPTTSDQSIVVRLPLVLHNQKNENEGNNNGGYNFDPLVPGNFVPPQKNEPKNDLPAQSNDAVQDLPKEEELIDVDSLLKSKNTKDVEKVLQELVAGNIDAETVSKKLVKTESDAKFEAGLKTTVSRQFDAVLATCGGAIFGGAIGLVLDWCLYNIDELDDDPLILPLALGTIFGAVYFGLAVQDNGLGERVRTSAGGPVKAFFMSVFIQPVVDFFRFLISIPIGIIKLIVGAFRSAGNALISIPKKAGDAVVDSVNESQKALTRTVDDIVSFPSKVASSTMDSINAVSGTNTNEEKMEERTEDIPRIQAETKIPSPPTVPSPPTPIESNTLETEVVTETRAEPQTGGWWTVAAEKKKQAAARAKEAAELAAEKRAQVEARAQAVAKAEEEAAQAQALVLALKEKTGVKADPVQEITNNTNESWEDITVEVEEVSTRARAEAEAEAQKREDAARAKAEAAAKKAEAVAKKKAEQEDAARAKAEAAAKKAEAVAKKKAEQEAAAKAKAEAATKRKEAAAQAKAEAEAKRMAAQAAKRKPSPPAVQPSPPPLPPPTTSIFSQGSVANPFTKSQKDKSSNAAAEAPVNPKGYPTIENWKKNRENTISGFVTGAFPFSAGELITTSQIVKGDIKKGNIVETKSGSKYFLK